MKLSQYIKRFDANERANFALRAGTTTGHLNNVVYETRTASAALTRSIALLTLRQVAEWDLRPHDWFRIWPELVGHVEAPEVLSRTPDGVILGEARQDANPL